MGRESIKLSKNFLVAPCLIVEALERGKLLEGEGEKFRVEIYGLFPYRGRKCNFSWINISGRGRFFPPLSLLFSLSPLLSRFWYRPSINGDWTRVGRKYRGIIAVNSIEKFHYQREKGEGVEYNHPLPLTSGSATIARVIGGWERRARLFEPTNLSDRLTKLVREGGRREVLTWMYDTVGWTRCSPRCRVSGLASSEIDKGESRFRCGLTREGWM